MSITPTEQRIIDLLQASDKRALNLLYENYSSSLYGVILKITINEEIAEDALQETFIKVWKILFQGDCIMFWYEGSGSELYFIAI